MKIKIFNFIILILILISLRLEGSEIKNARNLFFDGKLKQAENVTEKILKKNRNSSEALFLLGRIYYRQNKLKSAISIFEKIRMDKLNSSEAMDVGFAYYNAGEYQKSILAFEQVGKKFKSKPIADFYMGVSYMQIGYVDKGKIFISRANPLPKNLEIERQKILSGNVSLLNTQKTEEPPQEKKAEIKEWILSGGPAVNYDFNNIENQNHGNSVVKTLNQDFIMGGSVSTTYNWLGLGLEDAPMNLLFPLSLNYGTSTTQGKDLKYFKDQSNQESFTATEEIKPITSGKRIELSVNPFFSWPFKKAWLLGLGFDFFETFPIDSEDKSSGIRTSKAMIKFSGEKITASLNSFYRMSVDEIENPTRQDVSVGGDMTRGLGKVSLKLAASYLSSYDGDGNAPASGAQANLGGLAKISLGWEFGFTTFAQAGVNLLTDYAKSVSSESTTSGKTVLIAQGTKKSFALGLAIAPASWLAIGSDVTYSFFDFEIDTKDEKLVKSFKSDVADRTVQSHANVRVSYSF